MFLSFQGGNFILSVGGIWRPEPGKKPSLHKQEGLDVANLASKAAALLQGVPSPQHCPLSVHLGLQLLG